MPGRKRRSFIRPAVSSAHAERIALEKSARRALRRAAAVAGAVLLAACGGLWVLCARFGAASAALSMAVPGYAALQGASRAPEPAAVQTLTVVRALPFAVRAETHPPEPVQSAPAEPAPLILIYHTHATEAYLPTADAPYTASAKWRTKDPERSVVAVGAALCETLRTAYGIEALHDTTNHEPPKLSTAYSRSLETMLRYRTAYPSIRYYIDVHRDAYGKETDGPKDYVTVDGVETARLMFVVGTGEGATGQGFQEMPDFDANYAFVASVTERLAARCEGLTRDIRVKTGRYNQHVADRCLLVEVGHTANTFPQALAAAKLLAAALAEAIYADMAADAPAATVWAPAAP